ncbi:MAG: F0F1 ATP synthase subunit delta [Candidatus Dormibacteraeota bacterium]|uniref:ATP synthase subunit delta n=1 Tax=Candidatus Amunia macphersoniae TaxID=3127014 RepID=A0A934KJ59_9BACT|nr:F0F1 ATP synthase subunit delta [Candidatus Dormibacteraeota bacterium]
MASSVIARRYASAYFDVARDDGAVEKRGEDLARAAETLSNGEVVGALGNPRLAVVDRVNLALDLIDGVGESARNLCRLLVERNRISALPGVLEQYRILADRARGLVRAQVTTATEVTDSLRGLIADALRERFGADVEIEMSRDPSIIGGLVLRVGDRVIDNSLRTHLQQLQASLR